MAALLVPFAMAFASGQALRDGRLRAVFYLGVCLPEILHQGLRFLGDASTWARVPVHSPLGLLPWCYVAALLFEEEWRPRAFGALLAGSWLHLLVEAGCDSMSEGGIAWAFPFTMDRVGFALFRPQDARPLIFAAVVVIAVVELGGWVRGRSRRR
jgi:hypothetical protein